MNTLGSDIDLTLKGEHLRYQDLLDIERALDNLLLPYKVDLSLHRHLDNPALIKHIDRVGRQFYRDLNPDQANKPTARN